MSVFARCLFVRCEAVTGYFAGLTRALPGRGGGGHQGAAQGAVHVPAAACLLGAVRPAGGWGRELGCRLEGEREGVGGGRGVGRTDVQKDRRNDERMEGERGGGGGGEGVRRTRGRMNGRAGG